ncbi:NAD(P)-dependent dehydrogenase (short-subunit alcohol dehydrogenase family) [Paraburkholderia sp. BL6669N2]|uniref:SDR family NAD(P)-dependent oxidoreductase n=1 Tax=Paraburkholderia sp. BL6669N2 TaxID=1938807 RepID=UPI000E22CCB8|nr:SDR family oxidoreductase [Paraburkholderia sp. BL6669N2]REG58511.1 NAD(P)-dependent dehydrogenase (short-subunit alcohol dehydrogenase family) [Paraburkholderia sp. BL6669N2]
MSTSKLASLFDLDGRVAVVTGAGSGIGRETALLLASAGAVVVAADLNEEGALQTVAQIDDASGRAIAVKVDIGDEASITGMFDTTHAKFGRLDILVNNAGIYPKTSFVDTSAEKWDRVLRVNLRGTFLCMREAIKRMQAGNAGGSIINISSVASLQPVIFDNGDYGASKAGVNNLTKVAALEFAADRIRVNAVLPGGVATEGAAASTKVHQAHGPITQPGRMPLGRIGSAADIASAVLFFASPAADYVTGQLLAVDGGFQVS